MRDGAEDVVEEEAVSANLEGKPQGEDTAPAPRHEADSTPCDVLDPAVPDTSTDRLASETPLKDDTDEEENTTGVVPLEAAAAGGDNTMAEPSAPAAGGAAETSDAVVATSSLGMQPIDELDRGLPEVPAVIASDVGGELATEKSAEASSLASRQPMSAAPQPVLLTLPIDSLHCVASFLFPFEWSRLGQSSKGCNRVCREVFRRVRMHGFRCATEVVTAWKIGQHADAKELSALYIAAGVPIYPLSLGHSYHTLVWRMATESKEMNSVATEADTNDDETEDEADGSNPTRNRTIDPFYAEREEVRGREGYSHALTYLEEKSLFSMNGKTDPNEGHEIATGLRRQLSITPNRLLLRPDHDVGNGLGHGGAETSLPQGPLLRLPSSARGVPLRRGLMRSNSHSDFRRRTPKTIIQVHRHLLDQHLLGRPSVDDNDGIMHAPPVSLSADFFHPHFSFLSYSGRQSPSDRWSTEPQFAASDGFMSGELLPTWSSTLRDAQHVVDLGALTPSDGILETTTNDVRSDLNLDGATGTDDSDSEAELALRPVEAIHDNIFEPANDVQAAREHRHSTAPAGVTNPPVMGADDPNILSNVDLEVYSASSTNSKLGNDNESQQIRSHLKARFGTYQRRLDAVLSQNDSAGFDECILDFWDEFLPQTCNIHYYDRHTPVPRISRLRQFLTKPCPKAIGIVQCEIERIKLNSKKKGVSMKGRFFPTYEYRLFIRHRPSESAGDSDRPRRDTVLMMAKNRGRRHLETPGQLPNTNRKGSNNYYLYVPQQPDVEQHYKSVNGIEIPGTVIPNGAVRLPNTESSGLLGRLQSNFIGTEFQIFTPQVRKQRSPKGIARSVSGAVGAGGICSDDELCYDSGVSNDNPSAASRRKGRFKRLSLRRSGMGSPGESRALAAGESPEAHNAANRSIRRSRSSGDVSHNRPARTSRRAIANTADYLESQRSQTCLYEEEEDGAITYTANLLGSRPRIMDVCIPKISSDGAAGTEWKKYIDSHNAMDLPGGNRMLDHLKQIQQRVENEEQGRGANANEARQAGADGEYSPPGDFGLLALQNRPPWWNIELGSFVLNFGGRVSVASVKNFQLCDRSDQDYIMLQFGRIQGRHSFTMDFQYPLTAVQAFAIAISSLQSKISFG